jgi:hypothetical protein
MQLPKLLSLSVPQASGFYIENKGVALYTGIELAASSACVARCTNAANRCSYCNPLDIRCWDDCAGVGVGNCIAQCP